MIYAYGVTQRGTYHIKSNLVLQDAYKIEKYSKNVCIAAIADGLGSEEHSDIASSLVVETVSQYCKMNIKMRSSDEDIINEIRNSFFWAQKRIEEEVEKRGHELDQYGTTLSLAILINDTLYYGHAGDSGIIALTTDGLYEKITTQQRDEEGRVYPLNFNEDKWVFGKAQNKVASVFLATDGMYETLFPIYLRDEKVNIYVALARFFMDNSLLKIDKVGEKTTQDRIADFMNKIPDAQVNDDKTVVVMVNSGLKPKVQHAEYYAEPNWAELKRKRDEEWKREAYPHLFEIKEDAVNTNSKPFEYIDGTEQFVEGAIPAANQNNTEYQTNKNPSNFSEQGSLSSDSSKYSVKRKSPFSPLKKIRNLLTK